jgi:hypothetical protein
MDITQVKTAGFLYLRFECFDTSIIRASIHITSNQNNNENTV